MRPKPKPLAGIFSTRKRLSDGSSRTYWYHRASGNRLPGDYGSAEFLAAYLEANRIVPENTETVEYLIREYLMSPKFERNLATRTKAEYRRMLTHLEAEFGSKRWFGLSEQVPGVF